MKMRFVIPLLCFAASAAMAGRELIEESFSSPPDSGQWKILGDAVASGGKLDLVASGDEANFVNSGLQRKDPMNELNFFHGPVEIQLSKLAMGGAALPEKQAFIVLLATDRASETEAAAYLRLCVDGNGRLSLAVSAGEPGEGRSLETLASGPVAFPISRLELLLKPEGYQIQYTDDAGSQQLEGQWDGRVDPALWQNAAPSFVIKAVRRPGEGTCEVSLGSLKVKAP